MSTKKKAVAKAETYTQEKVQETVKKVGQWTPQSVAQKVTDATISVNKTFSEVSSQLQGVLTEYEDANLALQAKKDELEAIFGKEQVLKNIDELNVDFEAQKQAIETQRQNDERTRAQEEADFQFNLAQSRKDDEVKYQEELRLKKASQRDEDEGRHKAFLAREEELKKRENELVELRAKVATFPDELNKEAGKQRGIAEAGIKRDYEHKLSLLQKDFDTSKLVADNTIQGYNARLAANDKVIGELTTQLNDAYKKIENISNKAVESAAATKSLADLQSMVQTQSNGQTARKA